APAAGRGSSMNRGLAGGSGVLHRLRPEPLAKARGRGLCLTFARLAICGNSGARAMTTLLYSFRVEYILTVAASSLILIAVAALACYVRARNAARVDPVTALWSE